MENIHQTEIEAKGRSLCDGLHFPYTLREGYILLIPIEFNTFYVGRSKAVVDLGFKVPWYLSSSVRVLVAQWQDYLTGIWKIWVRIPGYIPGILLRVCSGIFQ